MIWTNHRKSDDVDIFISDPQVLGYLNPDIHAQIRSPNSFEQAAHYIKLNYPEGEIDFIVAHAQTVEPHRERTVEGVPVKLDTPVETAIKKLVYRGVNIKPRDIFDLAVVITREREKFGAAALNHIKAVEETLEAIDRLKSGFIDESINALDLYPEWKPIASDAEKIVCRELRALMK